MLEGCTFFGIMASVTGPTQCLLCEMQYSTDPGVPEEEELFRENVVFNGQELKSRYESNKHLLLHIRHEKLSTADS